MLAFNKLKPCIGNYISDNILDKFVGKYVSSEYDELKLYEIDKHYFLNIKSYGLLFYQKNI